MDLRGHSPLLNPSHYWTRIRGARGQSPLLNPSHHWTRIRGSRRKGSKAILRILKINWSMPQTITTELLFELQDFGRAVCQPVKTSPR